MKGRFLRTSLIIFIVLTIISVFSLLSCTAGETAQEETPAEAEQEEQAEEEMPEETEEETSEEPEETAEEEEVEPEGDIIPEDNINPISGLELSGSILDIRPFAIMIENSPDSRPQSALNLADTVFEIVDEGGITRFVGVFSSYMPDLIGPVRSARQYYGEVARSFDPIYVFWGTYPEGFKIIENLHMDYLTPLGDQSGNSSISANFIDGNGIDSLRDSSRVAPHNAYVFGDRLQELAVEQGYSIEGGQSPYTFKYDAPAEERGSVDNIVFDFSTGTYRAEYQYDSQSNTYLRFLAGEPHTDRESGEQIEVNNIIAMVTDIRNSGDAAGHMIVRTTGAGTAFFFIDGNMIEGTWERDSVLDPFEFKDDEGKTVLFNAGSTWIGMLPNVANIIF